VVCVIRPSVNSESVVGFEGGSVYALDFVKRKEENRESGKIDSFGGAMREWVS
jgi:hypothetical protein